MSILYLDYNCFQRSFDDPLQARIQLEAIACQELFRLAEQGVHQLVWSFMHCDENLLCPFPDRRMEAFRLSQLCEVKVAPEQAIYQQAKLYQQQAQLSAKDALHLACAVQADAEAFLTCDDQFLSRAGRLALAIAFENPVDYIRRGSLQ